MLYSPKVVEAYYAGEGLPRPVFEFRFHPERKWRFDLAFPSFGVAVEVEGGIWRQGRHSRGAGMKADMEKYNTAAVAGWTVLRFEPRDLCLLETVQTVRAALVLRGWKAGTPPQRAGSRREGQDKG